MTKMMGAEFCDLSVLVLGERWPGSTGLSAYDAFVRGGACVASICEGDVIPLRWNRGVLRGVARVLRPAAVREFNRQLLRLAESVRPNLFLAFKGMFVENTTLRRLKALGVTCFNFFPDNSFLAHGPYVPEALPEYDWVFSTKHFGPQDLKMALGVERCSVLLHAFDPVIHRPRHPTPAQREQYTCDVSFIGTWSPKKAALLEAFLDAVPGIDLRIWGGGWENARRVSPVRQKAAMHAVTAQEYATAIACSRVNLGLLSERRPGASEGDAVTSRTFHIPACGGLLLHQRTRQLCDLFREDVECLMFGDAAEMGAKVNSALGDEARARDIAAAGRRRVEAGHSWDHRAQEIAAFYRSLTGRSAGANA